jgi:hypothetical protein
VRTEKLLEGTRRGKKLDALELSAGGAPAAGELEWGRSNTIGAARGFGAPAWHHDGRGSSRPWSLGGGGAPADGGPRANHPDWSPGVPAAAPGVPAAGGP